MDDPAVSTRAVYQPGSATRKSIGIGCIQTERYIHRDQCSESVSGAAVCQQRSANQTPCGTPAPTKTCVARLAQLYLNREKRHNGRGGLDSSSDSRVPTHGATSLRSVSAFSGNPILLPLYGRIFDFVIGTTSTALRYILGEQKELK